MQFLHDQWKNPASRYGFLGAVAAFSLVGSLSTLPWLAVFGASAGIGLVLSVGIQVVSYFKSISDEAKHTLQGLNNTLEEAKRAVSRVSQEFEDAPEGKPPTIIQNVRGVVSRVSKEMDNAPKNEPPTVMQNVKAAIFEAKEAVAKVNKELGEAPAGEEPTLAQTVKKTIGEVNETVDQGRSGWAGWFLNLNKPSAANKDPLPKPAAKTASAPKAPEPKAVAQRATRKKKLTESDKTSQTPAKALKAKVDEQVDEAAVDALLATFDQPAQPPVSAPVSQGWGAWARSWVPSFSGQSTKNVEPQKATPPQGLRKSTRQAAKH
ncbi:MAG: hypothetical protein AB7I18_05385 [Candidatus Berkiella sp.]